MNCVHMCLFAAKQECKDAEMDVCIDTYMNECRCACVLMCIHT